MKKFSFVFLVLVLAITLSGCSDSRVSISPNPVEVIPQITANQPNIRSEIKTNIDKLGYCKIINIEHMTKGIEEPQKFEPEAPKEFSAGMFKVTFQKVLQKDNGTSLDQVSVVCQTEARVGHLAKVVPGKTVVDGFIFYTDNTDIADIPKLINNNLNLKFNKDEEKYFIGQLYGRFVQKMTQSQANLVNHTKDLALAIYFNGNQGIEQFHQEQKDALKNKS